MKRLDAGCSIGDRSQASREYKLSDAEQWPDSAMIEDELNLKLLVIWTRQEGTKAKFDDTQGKE